MLCPKCAEKFVCKQGFLDHIVTHGVDPWRIKQLLAEWDVYTTTTGPHSPNKPCKCRMYGNRFECELQIYRKA